MKNHSTQSGFTLLEMFVAISVFIVVMLIAVGSLLAIIDASRKAQAQKEVLNNLNFALESMTRTVRVGSSYHCITAEVGEKPLHEAEDCPTGDGGIGFAFEHNDGDSEDVGDQYVFQLENGEIQRSVDSGTTFNSLTAPNVTVEYLNFYVTGTEDVLEQAGVLIVLGGFVKDSNRTRTDFNLETFVSQRLFEG